MISSVSYSFAQGSDCRSLNINVGSEFQQGESLNIGPPGLPGKHGPVGSKGDSGPKGNKVIRFTSCNVLKLSNFVLIKRLIKGRRWKGAV